MTNLTKFYQTKVCIGSIWGITYTTKGCSDQTELYYILLGVLELDIDFDLLLEYTTNHSTNTLIYSILYRNAYLYYYHIQNIFQKVLFCVITHLIGRNDRAICKRHCLSWRCIQCCVAHSASRSGPATATPSASLSSKYRIDVRAEQERRQCTHKLDHRV